MVVAQLGNFQKRFSMKYIKTILLIFNAQEKKNVAKLLLATLIMGFLETIGVISIVPFMSVVTDPETIQKNEYLSFIYNYLDFQNEDTFLLFSGFIVLIFMTVSNSYSAFMTWKMTYFVHMHEHRISSRLLKKYLSQPYVFFLNRHSSDLTKNMLSEVNRTMGGIILPAMQLIARSVIAIFILTLLFIVDPVLAISSVLILGGAYFIVWLSIRPKISSIGVSSTEVVRARYKIANESIWGIKDLKLRNSEKDYIERFMDPSEKHANYSAQSSVISQIPRYALETIAFGGIVGIVIYLIANNLRGSEVISMMALYAFAGYRLMPALQQIYYGFVNIQYNFPALRILIEDLKLESKTKFLDISCQNGIKFENKIELKDIRFSYPNVENDVLTGINLSIERNTTIGIVGSTGAGKTTMVDLILGLISPSSGSILIDHLKLSDDNLHKWQKIIGYVPQTIYLTDDTIANNIGFGVPSSELDYEKIIRAAKLANLDEFIQTLPNKYETFVGERGVRLSGGQRQRIGIARALYHEPEVLIFDEATSSLDGITENIILEAIEHLSHEKTIIMIAHRLTTVKKCDVIHFLGDGKVLNSGTYSELYENNETFRKMADTSHNVSLS